MRSLVPLFALGPVAHGLHHVFPNFRRLATVGLEAAPAVPAGVTIFVRSPFRDRQRRLLREICCPTAGSRGLSVSQSLCLSLSLCFFVRYRSVLLCALSFAVSGHVLTFSRSEEMRGPWAQGSGSSRQQSDERAPQAHRPAGRTSARGWARS